MENKAGKKEENDSSKMVIVTTNNVFFATERVEGGTFLMGEQSDDPFGANYDEDAFEEEGPVHQVAVSDFYRGQYEVMQALWQAVMKSHPSYFSGSGKSDLIRILAENYANKAFLVINEDDYRFFHPEQKGMIKNNDTTQPYSNLFTEILINEAINNRYDVIIKRTMRKPQTPYKTQTPGYVIDAEREKQLTNSTLVQNQISNLNSK